MAHSEAGCFSGLKPARAMRIFLFLAASLASLAWLAPAGAQPVRPAATLTLAQAERMAADLKEGMSLEEVQKLLGKPRRTALKNNGLSTNPPGQGTLQWSYTWAGSSTQGIGSSSQGNLHVQFSAKAPEQWHVNSWEWASY